MSVVGYEQVQRDVASGRELEARVLVRSAMRLNDCLTSDDNQKLFEAVSLNHKLWLLFYSEIESKRVTLPRDVEQNMLNLIAYVLRITPRAFARDREALESMVSINRRIAAGLAVSPEDQPVMPPDAGADQGDPRFNTSA